MFDLLVYAQFDVCIMFREWFQDRSEYVFQKKKMFEVRISDISEISEPEVKKPEPDPKCQNTLTGSILLYRNTRISEIPDPNPNAHPYEKLRKQDTDVRHQDTDGEKQS